MSTPTVPLLQPWLARNLGPCECGALVLRVHLLLGSVRGRNPQPVVFHPLAVGPAVRLVHGLGRGWCADPTCGCGRPFAEIGDGDQAGRLHGCEASRLAVAAAGQVSKYTDLTPHCQLYRLKCGTFHRVQEGCRGPACTELRAEKQARKDRRRANRPGRRGLHSVT